MGSSRRGALTEVDNCVVNLSNIDCAFRACNSAVLSKICLYPACRILISLALKVSGVRGNAGRQTAVSVFCPILSVLLGGLPVAVDEVVTHIACRVCCIPHRRRRADISKEGRWGRWVEGCLDPLHANFIICRLEVAEAPVMNRLPIMTEFLFFRTVGEYRVLLCFVRGERERQELGESCHHHAHLVTSCSLGDGVL